MGTLSNWSITAAAAAVAAAAVVAVVVWLVLFRMDTAAMMMGHTVKDYQVYLCVRMAK